MVWIHLAAAGLGVVAAQPIQGAITTDPSQAPPRREPHLFRWEPGEITCEGGKTLPSAAIAMIIPRRVARPTGTVSNVTYQFRLTREGRALDITRGEEEESRTNPFLNDLAPALAAARFEPSRADRECSVTFTTRSVPLVEADLEELVALRIHSRSARIPQEAWERFVSGTCSAKRTRALERHYPDYRAIAGKPGVNHWTFVSYDIDEAGVPRNIALLQSSGSAQLDQAARAAIGAGRFIDGDPRTGCWQYYYKSPDIVAAPEPPELANYGKQPEACELDDKWDKPPRLTFPAAYQTRGIEGWAVLRYDVAPWGEIGNVEVLDAQPAREMADLGKRILTSATFAPRTGGLSGCIERVMFRLRPTPEENANE